MRRWSISCSHCGSQAPDSKHLVLFDSYTWWLHETHRWLLGRGWASCPQHAYLGRGKLVP